MNAYFVALNLPDFIGAQLAKLTGDLAGVYWLNQDQYHITLAYFGRLDDETLGRLLEGLNGIKQKPLTLRLGAITLYPLSEYPRAVVCEVLKDDALDSLRRKVNRVAISIGLERKRERYHPHVTLGRFSPNGWLAGHPQLVSDYLASRVGYRSEPFDLYGFSLYASQPTETGYRYDLESEYDLI